MSMLFVLRRVTSTELVALLEDPSDIFFFLYGDEPYEPPRSFIKKIFGPKSPPKQKREWHAPADDMRMELDKNWHVLHYLFCRKPWDGPLPQATLMCGGTELGSVDVGYGPARVLNSEEVDDFLNFLNSLRKEQYASGITPDEFESNEIYGAFPGWGADDANNLWEYVEEMKSFFNKAKSGDNGIVLYLY